jgi:glycosyltransferase involved in cell wall biosynthesis
MRIILGIESYLPNISGVTIFVKRLATYLSKSRHDVSILTTSPSGKPYEEKDPAGFSIYRLKGWQNPFRKNLRVSSFQNKKEIKRLVKELNPDLVHLQDPAPICRFLLKEAKKGKIPVIVHNHFSAEFVLSYFKRVRFLHPLIWGFVRHISRNLYNQCSLVITPTEFVRKAVLGWGVKTPIIAISNGIELERFKPGKPEREFLEKFDLKIEDKIALYLGRLDKDKNIETLVRAIPKILEKSPDSIPKANIKFLFVGEGTDRKRLEGYIKEQLWQKQVRFLGFIPHEDEAIPKIYQAADLYWTASTIETQSLTTLEAMASGLPVVAANFGALPEIVHENENGFLVEPYDADGFARAAIEIFSKPDLAKRFSEKNIEVASHHDIKESFNKIVEAYASISNKKIKWS